MTNTTLPMRSLLLAALLLPIILQPAHAQPVLEPVESMQSFRSLENLRVWTFTFKAQDMGRLISFIDSEASVNGTDAIRINRKLTLDYQLLNDARKVQVEGESYVSASGGYYLGDDIAVTTDSLTEHLKLEVDSRTLGGYFTRGGREVERSLPWPKPAYAWDANFIDQLEIFLAFQPMSVGAEFIDSVFLPQSLLWNRIAGYCDDYYYRELYRGHFDSVFAIHLTEPIEMDLYYSEARELVRADFLTQGIRVYQDVNAKAKPEGETATTPAPAPPMSSRFSMERVGQYAVYLIIGLFGLAFFVRVFFRYVESYLAMAAGAVLFFVVLVTQLPLQEHLLSSAQETLGLEHFFLPTAVAAVIQELLKLFAIGLVLRLFRPQPGRAASVGAAVGAAFGVVEAIYMAGLSFEAASFWFILRDGSLILMHVVTGYLLGLAIGIGGKHWLHMLGLTVLLHLLIRFLPALSFVNVIDHQLAAIVMAGVVLVALVVVLLLQSRNDNRT